MFQESSIRSHPEWVRGLKHAHLVADWTNPTSHPEWVRGLKHTRQPYNPTWSESHPEWVRGLKLRRKFALKNQIRRTPSGCVD